MTLHQLLESIRQPSRTTQPIQKINLLYGKNEERDEKLIKGRIPACRWGDSNSYPPSQIQES